MPKKKYIVSLTLEERNYLEKLVRTGKNPAYKVNHARILWLADTADIESGWKDEDISKALRISVSTIERVRQKLVELGLEAALNRNRAARSKFCKLDGEAEAYLIALSCSEPPSGREHWTMKMLASKMVELDLVESISSETVRKTLKKTKLNRGRKSAG